MTIAAMAPCTCTRVTAFACGHCWHDTCLDCGDCSAGGACRCRCNTAPEEPTFYLGTHLPHWLRLPQFADVPLFISRNRLVDYRTFPRALGRWALDSGGFTELKDHGQWRIGPAEYVAEVRRIVAGVGRMPDFVAPQDWMCEPWVIFGRRDVPSNSPTWFHGTREARGLEPGEPEQDLAAAVRFHQERTVENFLQLRHLAPEIPWMPVLQGWALDSYVECAAMYESVDVDLAAEPIVGLGSVCRRQATSEIAEIVATFADRGLRLHGFGVKTQGLGDYGPDLASADSMAWSMDARRSAPLPGHTHRNCANCPDWALAWHGRIAATLTGEHPGRQMTFDLGQAA